MSRRRRGIFGPRASSSADSHGDRPWVYFMVDCFFLITEFFIIIFKFKTEELNLPGKLPPGGVPGPRPPINTTTEILRVHILQNNGQTAYLVQSKTIALPELEAILARTGQRRGVDVRISYESDTPWKEIVTVMNASTRASIENVGLQPLRATDAR